MEKMLNKTLDIVEKVLNISISAAFHLIAYLKRFCRENKRKIHDISIVSLIIMLPLYFLKSMYCFNVTVQFDTNYIIMTIIMGIIVTVFGKTID